MRQTDRIALTLPLHARWAQLLAEGIQETARERGILIDSLPADRTPSAIIAGRYRGLICASGITEHILEHIEPLLGSGIRMVQTTTQPLPKQLSPTICCDVEKICKFFQDRCLEYPQVGVLTDSSPLSRSVLAAIRQTGHHTILTIASRAKTSPNLSKWLSQLTSDSLVVVSAPMTAWHLFNEPNWPGCAVISIQDDPQIALRLRPSVSGLDLGLKRVGMTALSALLDEPSWPPAWGVKVVPPLTFHRRASTERFRGIEQEIIQAV